MSACACGVRVVCVWACVCMEPYIDLLPHCLYPIKQSRLDCPPSLHTHEYTPYSCTASTRDGGRECMMSAPSTHEYTHLLLRRFNQRDKARRRHVIFVVIVGFVPRADTRRRDR